MSTRVTRAPGGHHIPPQARSLAAAGRAAAATARKRSADAAGKPGRRASEEHHEHDPTCPMHTGRKAASSPAVRSVHIRVKGAKTAGPAAVADTRHVMPTSTSGAQRGGKHDHKRSAVDNRPAWGAPALSKSRVNAAKPSKPSVASDHPSARNAPTKKPASSKPVVVKKSGALKRNSTERSSSVGTKSGPADAMKKIGMDHTSGREEKTRGVASNKSVSNKLANDKGPKTNKHSEPGDQPRSDSIIGAGKSELGKFLEKLHFEEMYGSSDDEPDDAKVKESVNFTETWRTGDGDDEKMNALRIKPRKEEPSLSPSWRIEDLITAKKPERDSSGDHSKKKNRFSFLVDSSDDDEPDVNSPKPKAGDAKDFSRFDGFLRESLSPERNKLNESHSNKIATEKLLRPSTAARSGSAVSRDSRSRSRSNDRDPRRGAGRGAGPASARQANPLEGLIRPKSPGKGTSPRREKRSPSQQAGRTSRPTAAKAGAPARGSRSDRSPQKGTDNNRNVNSRTPSPEKGSGHKGRSSVDRKEKPQQRVSVPGREEPSRSRPDQKAAHQRRSKTPSPNAKDTYERYHDAYPDDEVDARSLSPTDRTDHKTRSPKTSRLNKASSPTPDASTRDYRSPRTSNQNGNGTLFSDALKQDYYSPNTAVQLRERREEQNGERKAKRKSLSLAGMSNPDRSADDDESDRLRRLIVTTEALEKRLFTP